MNAKQLTRSLIAAGLLMGSVACGGQAAAPAPAAATKAPAPPTVAAPAEFTFTGWAINEGASKDVVTGYMKAYGASKNAVIKEQPYPFGEELNQLVLQASGGSAQGAAQLDIAWLATMAATGKLKDLSAYAKDRGYTQAGLLSGQIKGVQYGLPWTTGSIGLAANKQLLDAAGVTSMPKTVAEFEAALLKIKKSNPDVIPYAGMTAAAQLKDILFWIWTFGGTVIDDKGNVTLGDAGSVAALEWYKSLLDRGLMNKEMDRFTARQLFSQGKVAFYDDAIVMKGIVTKDSPVKNLGDLIVPVARPVLKEGDAPQALLWGHIVVVFEGKNADAAAQWAQHLTSDLGTTTNYFEKLALPPTTDAALKADLVKKDTFTSDWSSKITASAKANPFALYAASARMESILTERVNAYLVGSVPTAKAALDKAAADITPLLK